MGIFDNTRIVDVAVDNLAPVAEQLMAHFRAQGYEVTGEPTILQGWHISLHHGGTFQAIVGTKTALNIDMTPVDGKTKCHVGIGIFGAQSVPTAISMLVFWPVLATQIWGLIKQAKLDDEALEVFENLLRQYAADAPSGAFCTQCGARLVRQAKFCSQCGVTLLQ